jgi:hypothetical protein
MSRVTAVVWGGCAAALVWGVLTLAALAWDTRQKVNQIWALELQRAQASQVPSAQAPPAP